MSVGAIQALAALATILRGKFVALGLGPSGVGVTSLIDQWVQSVAYVAALSLPLVSTRFLSRAHSNGPEAFRTIYATFLKALLYLSGVTTLAAVTLAWSRPGLFGHALAGSRVTLILALLALPGAILNGYFSNLLAAAQKPKASSMLILLANMTVGIAACAGLHFRGIGGMYAAALAGTGLVIVAAFAYLHFSLSLPVYVRGVSIIRELKREKEILIFAGLQFAATFAFSVSLLMVRTLTFNGHGAVESGLLQAQIAISQGIALLLNPPTFAVLMPIVNRRSDSAEKIMATNAYLGQFAFVLIGLTLAVVLFPKTGIIVLFSARFIPAADFLFVFALYVCLMLLAGAYQTLLIGLGDMKSYFGVTVLGQLVVCGLAFALIPSHGSRGAGAALLAGSATTLIGCLLRLRLRYAMQLSVRTCCAAVSAFMALAFAGWAGTRVPELAPMQLFLRMAILVTVLAGAFGASMRFPRKPVPA